MQLHAIFHDVEPGDVQDWIDHAPSWYAVFQSSMGVLVALLNLKFGPLRECFVRAWVRGVVAEDSHAGGLCVMLVHGAFSIYTGVCMFMCVCAHMFVQGQASINVLYTALCACAATCISSQLMVANGAVDSTGMEVWFSEVNKQVNWHHGGMHYLRRCGVIHGGGQNLYASAR